MTTVVSITFVNFAQILIGTKFGARALNSHKKPLTPQSKVPYTCSANIHRVSKFSTFCSTALKLQAIFFFERGALNDPKTPLTLAGQRHPTYVRLIPTESQILMRLTPLLAVSKIFPFSIDHNVKKSSFCFKL